MLKHTLSMSCLAVLWFHVSHIAHPRQSAASSSTQHAQSQSSVETVSFEFAVTDEEHRFVPGLGRNDFVVLEEGKAQSIVSSDYVELPTAYIFLLDASNSASSEISRVEKAARNFFRTLGSGDLARVGYFSEELNLSARFTNDADELATTLHAFPGGGWTYLFDALLESIDALDELSFSGRKVLVLVSDGGDTRSVGKGSVASSKDVIARVKRSEVIVQTLAIEALGPYPGTNKGFLRRLAKESGGLFLTPKGELNVEDAFLNLTQDVCCRYRITFVLEENPTAGEWRSVKILVKGRGNLRVRARGGYDFD